MTDKKNPNPPISIFTEIPPHPDIHGVYASPVYTLAGDTLPTLGTQPVPRAPAAAGGGAAGATSKNPKGERKTQPLRANQGAPALMQFPYDDGNGERKTGRIPIALHRTTGLTADVAIVDTIMVICQKDRKAATTAMDDYLNIKGNEWLKQVCYRMHSPPTSPRPFPDLSLTSPRPFPDLSPTFTPTFTPTFP